MSDLEAAKAAERKAALQRRRVAQAAGDPAAGAARLLMALEPHRGKPISGYMPMRGEIDPLPAMAVLARDGAVGVPVIRGRGLPLAFHRWTPEAEMQEGPFGARVPVDAEEMEPHVLIVPLVAFDRHGGRLGYGGGFYDRTLQRLRGLRPTIAVGFAWAAQEAEDLPLEPTDQPLDLVVTEAEIIRTAREVA